jgi:hypothetical protein
VPQAPQKINVIAAVKSSVKKAKAVVDGLKDIFPLLNIIVLFLFYHLRQVVVVEVPPLRNDEP